MIGVDVVEVARFGKETLPQFCLKVFTEAERAYLAERKYALTSVAGLFAAKEAVLKALGTGIGNGVALKDVEILHTELGQPVAVLHRQAEQIFAKLGKTLSVSISHTAALAIAVAKIDK